MAVTITIDQSGKPAGVADKAREDLATGTAVVLQASGPFSSYQWTILDAPPNATLTAASAATLTAPSSQNTNVTPDNDGTYLVEVQVDAGYGLGARDEDVKRITFYAGATLNPTIDQLPRRVPSWLEALEHNVDTPVQPAGSTLGWAWEWLKWFKVIQRLDGASMTPPGVGDDYKVCYGLSSDLAFADGVTVNAAETGLLVDGFVQVSADDVNVASTGHVRGGVAFSIYGYTGGGNHRLFDLTATNVAVGDPSKTALLFSYVTASGTFVWYAGGVTMMALTSALLDMNAHPITNATYFSTTAGAGAGSFRGGTAVSLYGITSSTDHPIVTLETGGIIIGDDTLTAAMAFRVKDGVAFAWYENTVSNLLMRLNVADGLTLHEDGDLSHNTQFLQDATARAMLIKPYDQTGDSQDGLGLYLYGGDTSYGYTGGDIRLYAGGGAGARGFVEVRSKDGYLSARFDTGTSTPVGLEIYYPQATAQEHLQLWVNASGSSYVQAYGYPSGYASLTLQGSLVSVRCDNDLPVNTVCGSSVTISAKYDTGGGGRQIGLYGTAPVSQAADPIALTDSTAGTPGTTLAALPDPADAPATADALRDDLVANTLPVLRNWAASFATQHNKFRAGLSATAGGIGVFA